MKRRAYKASNVNAVNLPAILQGREQRPVTMGIDVSKDDLKLMLRWDESDFAGVWTASNPSQIPQVIQLIRHLSSGRQFQLAVEPTGTYGDPLRQALHQAGIPLHKVHTKASHDYAEIFDAVPSQHDGKDAAIVAELCASGKSSLWNYQLPSSDHQRMAELVELMDVQRKLMNMWLGRLEALLARHWPEATSILKLRSMVLLRSITRWGSPAALAADPQAPQQIRRWSTPLLNPAKIQRLLESAGRSMGVAATAIDQRRLRRAARRALAARAWRERAARQLKRLGSADATIKSMGQVAGVPTACVMWVCLGDPRDFASAYAYRKAMGLNLAERSSGRWKGHLKISKRGSAMVRRWLYLAALRKARKEPTVGAWLGRSKKRHGGKSGAGLTQIMRKMSLALWSTAQGVAFEPERLFAMEGGR